MSHVGSVTAPAPPGASAPAGDGVEGGETATQSRFGSTLAALTGAGGAVVDAASERGTQILDAAGAGHRGVAANHPRSGGQPTGGRRSPDGVTPPTDAQPDAIDPLVLQG